jgi:HTH-type transcriptional regulator / antitoxin HigA
VASIGQASFQPTSSVAELSAFGDDFSSDFACSLERGRVAVSVRPIRTKRDYEAALKKVERRWGAKTGTSDGDRLDVLATLIDAYEAEHHPMDPPDPIEAIKFRMEQQGLTRRDLEEIIGTRTRIAEVLNRKRGYRLP